MKIAKHSTEEDWRRARLRDGCHLLTSGMGDVVRISRMKMVIMIKSPDQLTRLTHQINSSDQLIRSTHQISTW
jgi:hypothetical protein